jgi:virginiamycin A acetyltransferase
MPPDPANVRIPGMLDDQERNTVFLKPLVKSPKIEIGEYTYYNDYDGGDATAFETRNVLYTAGPERLVIGRFCAIATGVRFVMPAANHPTLGSTTFPFFIFGGDWFERSADLLSQIPSRGDTVVGSDVWIGRDAVIMPGVTIGHGAIVGARAVVASDVPAYGTVGGNPARLIRRRYSDEDIERLLRIAWWDWPVEAITEHVRAIWAGTPAELERTAEQAGLLR